MANKTFCDKCNKEIGTEKVWVHMEVSDFREGVSRKNTFNDYHPECWDKMNDKK